MGQSPDEVSITVAELAADALETPIEELPPLTNSIDPDALNQIAHNDSLDDITVAFSYAGLHVSVHADKTVYVEPIHDGSVHKDWDE